jgi:hypothetical protein
MSEEQEIEQLTEELGRACTNYDLSTVLTALTYLSADACIQTRLGEDLFLAEFTKNLLDAIQSLKDHDNGNCTHH